MKSVIIIPIYFFFFASLLLAQPDNVEVFRPIDYSPNLKSIFNFGTWENKILFTTGRSGLIEYSTFDSAWNVIPIPGSSDLTRLKITSTGKLIVWSYNGYCSIRRDVDNEFEELLNDPALQIISVEEKDNRVRIFGNQYYSYFENGYEVISYYPSFREIDLETGLKTRSKLDTKDFVPIIVCSFDTLLKYTESGYKKIKIQYSTNGGESWQVSGNLHVNLMSNLVCTRNGKLVILSGYIDSTEIMISEDFGLSWLNFKLDYYMSSVPVVTDNSVFFGLSNSGLWEFSLNSYSLKSLNKEIGVHKIFASDDHLFVLDYNDDLLKIDQVSGRATKYLYKRRPFQIQKLKEGKENNLLMLAKYTDSLDYGFMRVLTKTGEKLQEYSVEDISEKVVDYQELGSGEFRFLLSTGKVAKLTTEELTISEIGSAEGKPLRFKFFDDKNGIIVFSDNVPQFTEDGGESWTKCAMNLQSGIINSFFLEKSEYVFLLDELGNIFKAKYPEYKFRKIGKITITGFPCNISMKSESEGYIVCNSTWYSTINGGETWKIIDNIAYSPDVLLTYDDGIILSQADVLKRTANPDFGWYNQIQIENMHIIGGFVDSDGFSYFWGRNSIITDYKEQLVKTEVTMGDSDNGKVIIYSYPNPFNPTSNIVLNIIQEDVYDLVVYNTIGQKVSEIFSARHLEPGAFTFQFTPKHFSSGIYYCVLKSDKKVGTTKLIFTK